MIYFEPETELEDTHKNIGFLLTYSIAISINDISFDNLLNIKKCMTVKNL